ncbi:MAG TPA: prolipoprotein diacylglyceryl transferase [Selenomonadales bacterium]|nr:prolipoprotein diacylglyceryl transferase [Selenomonadales bacterium]
MGKAAFSIGPFIFYWYGLLVAAAILAAAAVTWWQCRLYRESPGVIYELTVYGVPAGLLVSRLCYVAANWPLYRGNPSEAFFIWQGGLALYGAFAGFLAAAYGCLRLRRLPLRRWADILAPGLALGQAVGQWGNFFNQEAFGYPTELPWGIYIDFALRPPGFEQFDFFHPVFVYASLWNTALFLLLAAIALAAKGRGRLKSGSLFLLYLALFSAGQLYFDGLRLDAEVVGGVRPAQLVSLITLAVSFPCLFYINR